MSAQPLVKEVVINAPVEKVWKAITDHNEMKNWYFDIPDFKPEVGFKFHFYGEDQGVKFLHLCEVKEVIPNKKLSYSWTYEVYPGESLVTFELQPDGIKTKLTLTHEGLETFPADNKSFARTSFELGWNEIIGKNLKNYVEGNKE